MNCLTNTGRSLYFCSFTTLNFSLCTTQNQLCLFTACDENETEITITCPFCMEKCWHLYKTQFPSKKIKTSKVYKQPYGYIRMVVFFNLKWMDSLGIYTLFKKKIKFGLLVNSFVSSSVENMYAQDLAYIKNFVHKCVIHFALSHNIFYVDIVFWIYILMCNLFDCDFFKKDYLKILLCCALLSILLCVYLSNYVSDRNIVTSHFPAHSTAKRCDRNDALQSWN